MGIQQVLTEIGHEVQVLIHPKEVKNILVNGQHFSSVHFVTFRLQ